MSSIYSIKKFIFHFRGMDVILDTDLASLFGTTTKRLNEQIKRNINRFPEDFMFQLALEEKEEVVANCDHLKKLKFSSVMPRVFTEHGVVMAANVVNSELAVEASVHIVRSFVELRRLLPAHQNLTKKINELDRKVNKHDTALTTIIAAIRDLIKTDSMEKKRAIGFAPWKDSGK